MLDRRCELGDICQLTSDTRRGFVGSLDKGKYEGLVIRQDCEVTTFHEILKVRDCLIYSGELPIISAVLF